MISYNAICNILKCIDAAYDLHNRFFRWNYHMICIYVYICIHIRVFTYVRVSSNCFLQYIARNLIIRVPMDLVKCRGGPYKKSFLIKEALYVFRIVDGHEHTGIKSDFICWGSRKQWYFVCETLWNHFVLISCWPWDDQMNEPKSMYIIISSIFLLVQWASCQIRKIAGCACARNDGNVFPATDFKENRLLTIPACIPARASRTCRDACRDR